MNSVLRRGKLPWTGTGTKAKDLFDPKKIREIVESGGAGEAMTPARALAAYLARSPFG